MICGVDFFLSVWRHPSTQIFRIYNWRLIALWGTITACLGRHAFFGPGNMTKRKLVMSSVFMKLWVVCLPSHFLAQFCIYLKPFLLCSNSVLNTLTGKATIVSPFHRGYIQKSHESKPHKTLNAITRALFLKLGNNLFVVGIISLFSLSLVHFLLKLFLLEQWLLIQISRFHFLHHQNLH